MPCVGADSHRDDDLAKQTDRPSAPVRFHNSGQWIALRDTQQQTALVHQSHQLPQSLRVVSDVVVSRDSCASFERVRVGVIADGDELAAFAQQRGVEDAGGLEDRV